MQANSASFDVVVIGYGYAGGNAAIAAADAGARVLLLEKALAPGGISICSAGGLRIADDADAAFDYLAATCGGKTPDDVLRVFAKGITGLADRLKSLGQINGAVVDTRTSPGNYPFAGHATFGFAYVEAIPGFDPSVAYPQVRGAAQGAMLFKVVADNVEARADRITVRIGTPVARLARIGRRVSGVVLADETQIDATRGVVLACGGFEAAPDLQAQFWSGGPALSAAYRHNSGDGIRMAQDCGAALWHMWHYHGSYGYQVPGYPFGVRVKRLPDWQPDAAGNPTQVLPSMAWVLLDQTGRRFMNEYEPYMQDTGARPLGGIDPATRKTPRNPAYLVVDAAGYRLYPLGKPTRNDEVARYDWGADNSRELANGVFRRADDLGALARILGADLAVLEASIARWNDHCAAARDPDFGRPPSSMLPLAEPPYYAAEVRPVISNTQGGPMHDAEQRVLDAFGAPIPGLYAAGECGSLFGHLYMSGGNLAECFVGGEIAGRNAASNNYTEGGIRK